MFPVAPFTKMFMTLLQTWIRNHNRNKVSDEITYPFAKLNGITVEILELFNYFTPHFIMYVTY